MANLQEALGTADISWRTWLSLKKRQNPLVANGAFNSSDNRTPQEQRAINDALAVQDRRRSRVHNRNIAHAKVSTREGVVFVSGGRKK